MTPNRSVLSWLFGKLVSVAGVFFILWLGVVVVAKFQEIKKLDLEVIELQSIESRIKDAATREGAAAQARVKELDQAAQSVIEARAQTLSNEIRQLSAQLPSPIERASAIARGDIATISEWASQEVAIRAKQQEHAALSGLLDYRAKLDEYERWMREGSAELERLRLEHVALVQEIEGLESQIDAIRIAHPVKHRLPGTKAYQEIQSFQAKRNTKARHTHDLKAKHDELSEFLRHLEKPKHPGTLIDHLNVGLVLEELRGAWGEIETRLKQDWFWRLIKVDFNTADLAKTAVIIVGVAALTPLGIKFVFFYVLAPIATRRPGVPLLPESSGRVLTGRELPGQASEAASSVSCRVTVDASKELLLHPEYRQSLPNNCEAQTQWILNRAIPLSSLAAGLYALTRIRAATPQTVVVSSTRDPLSEVSLITIPEGSSVMLLPRHIVGVLQARGSPLRITRHWRFGLHAWLTLQLRYLVFHGPVTLVVKGCRGVRVEPAEAGRSLNPTATIGFSANLRYSSRRCETFWGYLSAQQPLLNDSFAGDGGFYIYQEMPYQRRGGLFGRELEGVFDAMLKPLGI